MSNDPRPSRRGALAIAGSLLAAACSRRTAEPSPPAPAAASANAIGPSTRARMPALFMAHGSPQLLDDERWKAELAGWGRALGKPKAILMLSAHWTRSPLRIGAEREAPLVYDFSGFPERYYRVRYAAPPAPGLAARVRELARAAGRETNASERGLDHGAWVPLTAMYPSADVPVLQASLPSLAPKDLYALGKTLAPLRDEGILIVGSGFLTHNLGALDTDPDARPPSWAREMDAFCKESLLRRDIDALLDYRARAPGVDEALPTHEHFVPLFVALGAAQDAAARFPIEGFTYGSFTKRSVELG